MSRRRKRLSHVNHDRWLVSYADFITLLFAFFVVLYSSSQVDHQKVGKLAMAIQSAFQEMGVFQTSATRIPNLDDPIRFGTVEVVENWRPNTSLAQTVSRTNGTPGGGGENDTLVQLQQDLKETLAPEIARKEISLRREPEGMVISLREAGFFESGSAQMKQTSQPVFDRIASLLRKRNCDLRVEGHTDNVPIHNAQFSSNWELSTSRATEIVRLMIVRDGFDAHHLSAAGYSQFHPIATNRTSEGRGMNRRVDIVILGEVPSTAPAVSESMPVLRPSVFGPSR